MWALAVGGFALIDIAFAHLSSIPSTSRAHGVGLRPCHSRRHPKYLAGPTERGFTLANLLPGAVIAQVSVSGGEVAHVPLPAPTMFLLAVSPDGATLLVADEVGQTAFRGPLWAVPVLGGSPRRLGETAGQAAAWSPDGLMIAYCRRKGPIHGKERWRRISQADLFARSSF